MPERRRKKLVAVLVALLLVAIVLLFLKFIEMPWSLGFQRVTVEPLESDIDSVFCNDIAIARLEGPGEGPMTGVTSLCLTSSEGLDLRDAFIANRGDTKHQSELRNPESQVQRAFTGITVLGLESRPDDPSYDYQVYVAGNDTSMGNYVALCSFAEEADRVFLCKILFEVEMPSIRYYALATAVGSGETIAQWPVETRSMLEELQPSNDDSEPTE